MDTSEKYVTMCIKGFKDIGYVQTRHLPNLLIMPSGDFYCTWKDTWEEIEMHPSTALLPTGQLYRQDQLQKMVEDLKFSTREIMPCLCELIAFLEKNWGKFDSWEQLWLAFVMKEKFDKVWDDEKGKWIEGRVSK